MTETTPPFNPYVGPRTFQEKEADRFFGREREARELLALVVSERLTLFYAQSGAGKSSLLNARVIPRLRDQEGFTVLPVGRVTGVLPDEVDPGTIDNIFVYHLIQGLSQKLAEKEVRPPAGREQKAADLAHTSLARFLSGETGPDTAADAELAGAASAEGLVPYVLIIDQFEELLTTYPDRWQERTGFFEQLSAAMARHPNLWVVLTLREDYIAGLEPNSHLAPNRLRARFYMQRMGIEAAREAVERPAANANRPFAEGVAGMLVDNLRMVRTPGQAEYHAGEYVEPVQLQVVCFQLWEDLRSKEAATIELADLVRLARGGSLAEYVDGALSDFYEKAIARVLETPAIGVTEPLLRSWFSDKLITKAGTRSIVFRNEDTGETDGLPNRAVTLLGDQFLLRTELRAGGAWVELVHDRFIEPIREANRAWFARNLNPLTLAAQAWREAGEPEGRLYTGSQLAAAAAELQAKPGEFGELEQNFVADGQRIEAQRKRRTWRRRAAALGVLSFAAIVLSIVAVGSAFRATASQRDAETARATAAVLAAEAMTREVIAQAARKEAETKSAVAEDRAVVLASSNNPTSIAENCQRIAAEGRGTDVAVALSTSEAILKAALTAQAPSVPPPTPTFETTRMAGSTMTSDSTQTAPATPTATDTATPNLTAIAQQAQLARIRVTQTAVARCAPFRIAGATSLQGLTDAMIDQYKAKTGCDMSAIVRDYVGTAGGFEAFCAGGSTVDIVLATGADRELPYADQCRANGREFVGFQVGTRPQDVARDRPNVEPLSLYTDPTILRRKPQVTSFIRFYLEHSADVIAGFAPNEYQAAPDQVIADALRRLDSYAQ